jgi:hypothetical protein
VLIPIVGPREHRAPLVPDYLLGIQKVDSKQAVQHFTRKDARVPNISDLPHESSVAARRLQTPRRS